MRFLEYGDRENKIILLIHGFQSPYQIWNEYIEHYKKDFHIIVPILPGHNPKSKDEFVSLEQTAKEIEDFCISNYSNDIYAIYGMSFGGVVASKLWQNKRLLIGKLIFDSSPLVSYNRLVKCFMTKFYLSVTKKIRQKDEKTLQQAKNVIVPESYLEDFRLILENMTDTTIINCLNAIDSHHLPSNIDPPNTGIFYFHGTTPNEMYAVKSGKYISKHYPNSTVRAFKGKGHCEISLMSPQIMIAELDKILYVK